jgi:hypothetical protein
MAEGHRIDVLHADTSLTEAEGHGAVGEGLGVFLSVEPLFLGECDEAAVLEEAGRRIVGETVDSQDVHGGYPVAPDARGATRWPPPSLVTEASVAIYCS